MEFLIGRSLGNNILNLYGQEEIKEALDELKLDLANIEDQEPDPALGNGGLGRLAACFLDSLSTLGYPAYGCEFVINMECLSRRLKMGIRLRFQTSG